jgi:hypothetical protein
MDSLIKKEKHMKKIYIFLMTSILLMSSALAESITIIPGSKPGGSNFTRATMYQEVLQKMGHTVKFENITTLTEATKYLEDRRGKENVILPYPSNQPAQIGYYISDNNFILNEYSAPYYWCQSTASLDKNKLIIGLDKNMNQKFSDKLFAKLGKEVVYLRYKNSGDLYNAITSGDIDVMFTNQVVSLKLVNNNQGTCIANTDEETANGVPSIYTIVKDGTKFPVMDYPIISNNTSNNLRNILLEANKDPIFTSWRQKGGLAEIVGKKTRKNELKIIEVRQHLWK